MSKKTITVERLPDGLIRAQKGSWRDDFPEERRLPWANWYEAMHMQYGYPGYLDMAKALRELA